MSQQQRSPWTPCPKCHEVHHPESVCGPGTTRKPYGGGIVRIKLNMPVTFYEDFSDGRHHVTFPKGWEFDDVINKGTKGFWVLGFGPVTHNEATVLEN